MTKSISAQENNRRNPSNVAEPGITENLPEYFQGEYPSIIKFLETYYEFEDSDLSPTHVIRNLMSSRDITSTSDELLVNIEDELLLGQSYFEGFTNKRAAAKFSNYLYRSKGSLYSIEQFFRMFFNEAPNVRYTKEDRFMLNDSLIGPNSQKYLTDDKLYQVNAIQIKIGIPIDTWREEYKLFVHPAGMYYAGQVQIEAFASLGLGNTLMPDFVPTVARPTIEAIATAQFGTSLNELTKIVSGVELTDNNYYRVKASTRISDFDGIPISEVDTTYDTIGKWLGTSSPTFDEDSDGADFRTPRFSTDRVVFDTFDEVEYDYYDSSA
jgi:hypothetical protein